MPTETMTTLQEAAKRGDVETVEAEVAKGVDVNERSGWAQNSALHWAAAGNPGCTLCLLVHGADVNARDYNEKTPLHKACAFGDADCVRLMLQAGADIHVKDEEGKTPVDYAQGKRVILALLDETTDPKEKRRAKWLHEWNDD